MRGRTFTVGVLVVELRNPFVPDIIDGVKPLCRMPDTKG